ncbi:hypothetical protein C8J56DRAFT_1101329 [Mycena floridula]|nr:hypothetical protein C8J56DRAFT_1101329 [Mycena floridula]
MTKLNRVFFALSSCFDLQDRVIMNYLILFAFVASLQFVSSSIYCTEPVASTVWTIGNSYNIRWKDSDRKPSCKDISSCTIKIFSQNKDYVGTFAENISPNNYTQQIYLPDDWDYKGTKQTIRFYCDDKIYYTADFQCQKPDGAQGFTPVTMIEEGITIIHLLPTSTPISSSSEYPAETSSVARVAHSFAATSRIDVEKLKFRMVFIAWPALIGISMAL